jgi:hypothetical protein
MLLREDDISRASNIISTAKVVVCQLEIPTSTTRAALTLAKEYNGSFKCCSLVIECGLRIQSVTKLRFFVQLLQF